MHFGSKEAACFSLSVKSRPELNSIWIPPPTAKAGLRPAEQATNLLILFPDSEAHWIFAVCQF